MQILAFDLNTGLIPQVRHNRSILSPVYSAQVQLVGAYLEGFWISHVNFAYFLVDFSDIV